jgi:Pyridine nucleotide-disulphide oxidoreductase
MMAEVTGVDLSSRSLDTLCPILGARKIAFDYLVIATGMRPSYFGHDEFAKHAPALKTLGDVEAIRAKILSVYEAAEQTDDPGERARQMTIVLVGAGQTNWVPWIFAAKALVLWAVIAAATPEAARRRFVRAARQALVRIAAPRQRIGLAEFDTVMTEALDQLKSGLSPDQPDDIVWSPSSSSLPRAPADMSSGTITCSHRGPVTPECRPTS